MSTNQVKRNSNSGKTGDSRRHFLKVAAAATGALSLGMTPQALAQRADVCRRGGETVVGKNQDRHLPELAARYDPRDAFSDASRIADIDDGSSCLVLELHEAD